MERMGVLAQMAQSLSYQRSDSRTVACSVVMTDVVMKLSMDITIFTKYTKLSYNTH